MLTWFRETKIEPARIEGLLSENGSRPICQPTRAVELLGKASGEPVCYAEIPGAQHAFEVFHSLRSAHVVRGVERFLGWLWTRHRAAAQAPQASGSETTSITT